MKTFSPFLILCVALSVAEAQTAADTTGSISGQTITGVLMDASCAAITGGSSQASSSTDAVRNSTTSTSAVTHSGRSSPTEGIRNNSASAQGTTGTADTSGSTSARVSDRDRTARSGHGTAIPSDETRAAAARAADERNRMGSNVTGSSQVAGATSGAGSASALGTTGAATDVAVPSGERSRTAASSTSTIYGQYAQCQPTANTRSFAIHADGRLYLLDHAGNEMVRQQMSGEAFRSATSDGSGQPKWMTVTVIGTPGVNNTLAITSVRK